MGDLVSKIRFIVTMLVITALMAGCGTKQTQETKPPTVAQVGIIDMSAAVKAHPKYKQLVLLQQEADAMIAQIEAEQVASIHQAGELQSISPIPGATENAIDELHKAAEQEANRKLAAKESELNERLTNKANSFNRTLDEEMKAYNDQLDKEYQPQIFNIQLKLKIVQLSKEEAASMQMELDKLQTERSEALNLKQEELKKRLSELMAPENAALGKEFETYRKKIDDELATQIAAKQGEILNRGNKQQLLPATTDPVNSENPQQLALAMQQQLALKQQEIDALQGFILDNITEKTGKVATEGGFEVVLTHVVVNVSAVDITVQVITECNK